MQLMVLGSAAAEGIPDPFCRCRVCEHARRTGGHEMRSRAAAIINDDLLIDFGPDIVSSANRNTLYLGNLRTLLVTHRHGDHWLPNNLVWREPGFVATPVAPLAIYGPHDALVGLESEYKWATELALHPVKAGDRWSDGRYTITAVPATHGGGTLEPLLYVIDDGAHRVFYATDTSTLREEAWDVLRPLGPMDLILLDQTCGLTWGGDGHHGLDKFMQTRERMMTEGVLGEASRLVAHHFSHNGGLTHAELTERLAPHGVTVAYDGLVFAL